MEVLAKTRRGELRIGQAAMSELLQHELRRQTIRPDQGGAGLVKAWLGSDQPALRVFMARGCSLSRESADKHGGALEFETQRGRRALFYALLPASHDIGTHAQESQSPAGGR